MLIAIDHGNKQIKTVHTQPFTSGLIQGDTPGFGTDCMAYQGKYYTLTDQRIPYRRDKTEDERFFILTLFAITYEIEAMGRYAFAPHTQGHELHRKGLAGAAGPKNGNVGVFVDAGIENVHNDERIVVLVDAEKNAVVITHLIACKWIAAGRTGGKDIALRPLVELAFQ